MDNEQFKLRLEVFRNFIGLGPWSPEMDCIEDNIHGIFVSPNNEIANALRNRTHFLEFEKDRVDQIKKRYELQGFHVYVANVLGTASGHIKKDCTESRAEYAMIYLHESFHVNPNHNLVKSIEEAAAYLVALEGAVAFFRICGSDEDLKEAYRLREKHNKRVKRFHIDYQTRITELKEGKIIDPSSAKNNAYLFSESLYCMDYTLLRKAYRKIGNLIETHKVMVYLPKSKKRAIEQLESIVNS